MLYSYVKAILATWTHHGMLTLLLGKTKIVLAGGALSVYVGFTVAYLAFLKVDELLRLVDDFDEFLVFLLSFVNISGHYTVKCVDNQGALDDGEDERACENIDNDDNRAYGK